MKGQLMVALGAGACGVVGALLLFRYAVRRRHLSMQERFDQRDELGFAAWYREFYSGSGTEEWVVDAILGVLGAELGVAPTRLRPSDRLEVELQAGPRWLDGGYKVSHMVHDVSRVLYKREKGEVFDPAETPKTLDDLIRLADRFVKLCRSLHKKEQIGETHPIK